jgi:hypothetical protein
MKITFDPLWVTAYATIGLAIATLLLAIVAAFQDRIRGWIMRPRLQLSVKMSPPECNKTKITTEYGYDPDGIDCYYLRIRISNKGNHPATNVQIYASELYRLADDDSWSNVDHFMPMNLKWSHIDQPVMPIIHRGMDKLCDLGHIIDPSWRNNFPLDEPNEDLIRDPSLVSKTTLSLDLEVIPLTFSHIILPGTYKLKIMIGSTESKPITKYIKIINIGTWHENELLFLGSCIILSMEDA